MNGKITKNTKEIIDTRIFSKPDIRAPELLSFKLKKKLIKYRN